MGYPVDIYSSFTTLLLLRGKGIWGKKGIDGLWLFSSSTGSFLPISNLLLMMILSRISTISRTLSGKCYWKQLAASIWVSESALSNWWGGGSTSTLSFCITSYKARGQEGSPWSLARVTGDPPGVFLSWIVTSCKWVVQLCFLLAISHLQINFLSGGWHAENATIPWNFSFPCSLSHELSHAWMSNTCHGPSQAPWSSGHSNQRVFKESFQGGVAFF